MQEAPRLQVIEVLSVSIPSFASCPTRDRFCRAEMLPKTATASGKPSPERRGALIEILHANNNVQITNLVEGDIVSEPFQGFEDLERSHVEEQSSN